MRRIRVAVAGAAGYVGAEVIRLILIHPATDLVCAQSRSQAGRKLSDVHHDLLGDTDVLFSAEMAVNVDVLFLCMAHGEAKKMIGSQSLNSIPHIIDLSQDFRLNKNAEGFVYGLSEWNREEIRKARHIANPGCFATAIQLALLPMIANKLVQNDVHITGLTGSTGAGQALAASSHFSWRANNISVYKAFQHQHMLEISEGLQKWDQNFDQRIHFIPYRGDFTRGIFCSIQITSSLELDTIKKTFREAYSDSAFVYLSENTIDLKQIINTNKCFIGIEKNDDQILITVVIDNLLKGAAGQAIQNMNLLHGFSETTGLNLKASAF